MTSRCAQPIKTQDWTKVSWDCVCKNVDECSRVARWHNIGKWQFIPAPLSFATLCRSPRPASITLSHIWHECSQCTILYRVDLAYHRHRFQRRKDLSFIMPNELYIFPRLCSLIQRQTQPASERRAELLGEADTSYDSEWAQLNRAHNGLQLARVFSSRHG